MPLDAAHANSKTEALNVAFAAIGTAGGTGMPRSKTNTEPLAWEYHVASHLARRAEARKKAAVRAAIKAGVMFDHEKSPMPEGTNALVYAGEVVEIMVGVTTPTTGLDTAAMFDDLERSGVKRALIDRLVKKHATENRAPHKFTSSLVTG